MYDKKRIISYLVSHTFIFLAVINMNPLWVSHCRFDPSDKRMWVHRRWANSGLSKVVSRPQRIFKRVNEVTTDSVFSCGGEMNSRAAFILKFRVQLNILDQLKNLRYLYLKKYATVGLSVISDRKGVLTNRIIFLYSLCQQK